jgi:hypothetical protein
VLSIVESIRNNPDKYISLISNRNDNLYSSLATVEYGTGQGYTPAGCPYVNRPLSISQQEQQSYLPQNDSVAVFVRGDMIVFYMNTRHDKSEVSNLI